VGPANPIDGFRHPGSYAGWRGGTYGVRLERDGRVKLGREEGGRSARGPGELGDVIADVPVAELDWWQDVLVSAWWQELEISVMKVDREGRASGYLANDHRVSWSEHVAEAERLGGFIEQVDRGEVHIGIPLERLEAVQETVTDLKDRWSNRPSPEEEAARKAEQQARQAEQRARDEARAAQAEAENEAARRQLLDDIATCLRHFLAPGWEKARIDATVVGYDRRVRVVVVHDGSERPVLTPDGLTELLRSLKELDRRSGQGTWFSATLELDRAGAWRIDRNMDREPDVQPPIAADDYRAELFAYQRSYVHVPSWYWNLPAP